MIARCIACSESDERIDHANAIKVLAVLQVLRTECVASG